MDEGDVPVAANRSDAGGSRFHVGRATGEDIGLVQRTSERAELCEQRRVIVADAADAPARHHVDRPSADRREGRQVKRQSADAEVQERQREQEVGLRRRASRFDLSRLHRQQ
jgi:hypothetical protein